jgi:hypothetical protein
LYTSGFLTMARSFIAAPAVGPGLGKLPGGAGEKPIVPAGTPSKAYSAGPDVDIICRLRKRQLSRASAADSSP